MRLLPAIERRVSERSGVHGKRQPGTGLDLDDLTDRGILPSMAASPRVQQILLLAAELSREEREAVTAELLSALEPGDPVEAAEWDEAWGAELARRAADESADVPLARVRERVSEALAAGRRERGGR
jgi:hypothetical protein